MNDLIPPEEAAILSLVRIQEARRNLLPFILATNPKYQPYAFHRHVAAQLDQFLEALERGESPRLIINCPPQHGKTETASYAFPAYILGRHPDWPISACTYNQDRANEVGRNVRRILTSTEFATVFPQCALDPSCQSMDEVKTLQRGGYRSVGMGGGLSGYTVKVAIIDDPHKDLEDADSDARKQVVRAWWEGVLLPRMVDPGGIIVIQTRWAEEDLTGWILDVQRALPENLRTPWKVVEFPAINTEPDPLLGRPLNAPLCPKLKSISFLKQLQATLSRRVWSAVYQQRPTPDEGDMFAASLIKYAPFPADTKGETIIGVDLAASESQQADYSVIAPVTFLANQDAYVRTITRFKGMDDTVNRILAAAERYQASSIVIERTQVSLAIWPVLQAEMQLRRKYYRLLHPAPAGKDKRVRAFPFRDWFERGKVVFTDEAQLQNIIRPEMLSFPGGRHDDCCFPAGTPIVTARGVVPIEEVITEDHVITRFGWKKVTASACTGVKPVVTRYGITATADHPVFTSRGFVSLDAVTRDDILLEWNQTQQSFKAVSIADGRTAHTDTSGSISGCMTSVGILQEHYIGTYGKPRTGQSQPDMSSTTRIKIHSTTRLIICGAFLTLITPVSTCWNALKRLLWGPSKRTWRVSDLLHPNGIVARLAESGTGSTQERLVSASECTEKCPASSAEKSSCGGARELHCALPCVVPGGEKNNVSPGNLGTPVPVYNLTVEDAHEFVAWGVLVHNCDALAWVFRSLPDIWGSTQSTAVTPPPPPPQPPGTTLEQVKAAINITKVSRINQFRRTALTRPRLW